MSRKDARKSIEVCPDASIWSALKLKSDGKSLSDCIRRTVIGVDWMNVTPMPGSAKGAVLSVQLPQEQREAMRLAAREKNTTVNALLLGAVRQRLLT